MEQKILKIQQKLYTSKKDKENRQKLSKKDARKDKTKQKIHLRCV